MVRNRNWTLGAQLGDKVVKTGEEFLGGGSAEENGEPLSSPREGVKESPIKVE